MSDLAIRARTVLMTSSHVEVGTPGTRRLAGAHVVDRAGAVLFDPYACFGGAADGLLGGELCPRVELVATDVTAVPQPDRVRARVRMAGIAHPVEVPSHPAVLRHLGVSVGDPVVRFVPDQVSIEVRDGAGLERWAELDVADYTGAGFDPLVGWESMWIAHLATGHALTLRALAAQRITLADHDQVCPLGADASGITLRIHGEARPRDLHVPFPQPAACGCAAVAGFRELQGLLG
ncbi:DUF2470 domain-containing protein [Granulicoccus phenolivorans]|uniref:DUF2470 domain-containing protein n=1 Tax=Granulicoccus phenolivorans TaxID=266854 RepID=UPI00047AF0C3|nr:DUF2470 domain-containing protein [Granulicoccus phenolivorans]